MSSLIEYSDSEPDEIPQQEVTDDEDPEEEPEEDDEEDPEEEEEPEENGGDDSALDFHLTVAKSNDSSQEVKSERDNEDLRYENSKESLAVVRSTSGDHCDSVNPSNELLDTHVRLIPHVGEEGTEAQNLRSGLVSSGVTEFHESLSDNKGIGSQLENRIVIDACINVQSEYNEEYSNQNLSSNIIFTDDGRKKSIPVDEKKIAAESLLGDNSTDKFSNRNLLFKEVTKQMDLLFGEDIKAKTSRSIIPQIRLRSSYSGDTFEEGDKRPAVLCKLFAGGWCIKGNSCKFLHHRDGMISTSKCDKQDAFTASSKDNLEENEETVKMRMSGENLWPHQFVDDHGMHMSPVPNIAVSSSAPEETIRYSGLSLYRHDQNHSLNLVGHTGPDSEEFVKGYTSSTNRLVPEHRSNGSLTQLSKYGNINLFASDKYGSHTSQRFLYSLNPNVNASLPHNSLHYTHKWSGAALSRPPSLDGDQEYSSSRSLLLAHSSAPHNIRVDTENLSLHDIPGSTSTGLGAQPRISNWEPSIPFRPSFSFSSFISSPRNQYDPLLDSIDSPNVSEKTFQVIQVEVVGNSQQANAGYVSIHQQPQYGFNKSMSTHGIAASRTSTATTRTFVSEHLNKNCVLKEENPLKPGHIGNTSNAMEADHHLGLSHADRSKHKEPQILKHFRASLVKFVKGLVKPYWHDGRLSKDAHNSIVKRAVEKVMSALQSHQIPNTVESITQYISSSRPKLTKLVELYVRMYAKS